MQSQDSIQEHGDPVWPDVHACRIVECGESLIDARDAGEPVVVSSAYWNVGFEHSLPTCYVRGTVLARLRAAADRLPAGLRLVVLDGFRPYALQSLLYAHFDRQISRRFPDLDAAAHRRLVRQFVAPPSRDAQAPSPHLAGGAVDVTLCDADGEFLEMGTAFDEPSSLSRTAAFESSAQAQRGHCARHNRRRLFATMTGVGFSNLASEWWHFDYGDQLWAWSQERSEAIYGRASLSQTTRASAL